MAKKEETSWKKWSPEFKEFAVYFAFLSLFSVIVFGPRNSDPFFMQKGLENTFASAEFEHGVSFSTMTSTPQFYNWVESVLLPNLYPEEAYNGDALTEEQKKMVGGVNRRLGVIQIRSIKVKPDSCEIAEDLKDKISHCYGGPTKENEVRVFCGIYEVW